MSIRVSLPQPKGEPWRWASVLHDGDSVALDVSVNGVDWVRIGTEGPAFSHPETFTLPDDPEGQPE